MINSVRHTHTHSSLLLLNGLAILLHNGAEPSSLLLTFCLLVILLDDRWDD